MLQGMVHHALRREGRREQGRQGAELGRALPCFRLRDLVATGDAASPTACQSAAVRPVFSGLSMPFDAAFPDACTTLLRHGQHNRPCTECGGSSDVAHERNRERWLGACRGRQWDLHEQRSHLRSACLLRR